MDVGYTVCIFSQVQWDTCFWGSVHASRIYKALPVSTCFPNYKKYETVFLQRYHVSTPYI